jgi:probable F420-dependent oxidoreductase
VQLGLAFFATEYAIPVDRLAALAEERGFESLFLPEHPVIPVNRRTPYPAGEPLPPQYWNALDPFVALAYAARATSRLRLGTGICLVTERHPLLLAKQVSSLDLLSGGRVLFGIGAGWLGEEMELFGTPFEQRWSVTRERVQAMKRLWTEEEPEFHGRYVDFPPVKLYPKPVQKPHPPVLIGAASRWARRRVVAWGDGWMPNFTNPERFANGRRHILQMATERGRDPAAISFTVFGAPPNEDTLRAYQEGGADRVLFSIPSDSETAALAALDRCTAAGRAAGLLGG